MPCVLSDGYDIPEKDIPDLVLAATTLGHQDSERIEAYYRKFQTPEIPENLRSQLVLDSTLGGQNPDTILAEFPKFANYPVTLQAEAIKTRFQPARNKALVDNLYNNHFAKYPDENDRLPLIQASFFPGQKNETIDAIYDWFNERITRTEDKKIIKSLVFSSVQIGFTKERVFHLYNSFNASNNNPNLSAFKVRAATIYFPQYNELVAKRPKKRREGLDKGPDASAAQLVDAPLNTTHLTNANPLDPGGIDMSMLSLDLQIKRDGKGVPLPINLQNLSNIHINGLRPTIVKDYLITNIYEFLGSTP